MHGIGGAKDLPIPLGLAIGAGVAALVISFLVLSLAWRTPRHQELTPGRPAPRWIADTVDRPGFTWTLRALGLLFFGYLTWALVAGPDLVTNPVLGTFYVLVWVGIVPFSLFFGPVVRAVSPVRTINLLLARAHRRRPRGRAARVPRPARLLAGGARHLRLRLAGAGQPPERLPRLGAAVAGRVRRRDADRRGAVRGRVVRAGRPVRGVLQPARPALGLGPLGRHSHRPARRTAPAAEPRHDRPAPRPGGAGLGALRLHGVRHLQGPAAVGELRAARGPVLDA